MVELKLSDIASDAKTSATAATLHVGKRRLQLPNRFPTTAEWNASDRLEGKPKLPGEIVVQAKLMFPESWKKLLKDDEWYKAFARRLSREAVKAGDVVRAFFLVFRGDISLEDARELRAVLDLQYLSGFDLITVQQTRDVSPNDFASQLKLARRWRDQRGLDRPLMPVLSPHSDRDEFKKYLDAVEKVGHDALGFDAKGGFYYHCLRLLEDYKKRRPETWIHLFQVMPKVRFAGRIHPCSQGMVLPYFGVDSFSRWVVPPPPEPLTKDKINFFDRRGWGEFKRKEFVKIRGEALNCTCAACGTGKLGEFFKGKVITVLYRSKVHDHLAQREELEASARRIRERTYSEFIRSKTYPKQFLAGIE